MFWDHSGTAVLRLHSRTTNVMPFMHLQSSSSVSADPLTNTLNNYLAHPLPSKSTTWC